MTSKYNKLKKYLKYALIAAVIGLLTYAGYDSYQRDKDRKEFFMDIVMHYLNNPTQFSVIKEGNEYKIKNNYIDQIIDVITHQEFEEYKKRLLKQKYEEFFNN